jgi:SPP1 gp7 family putative phage head morphogenesis protein
MIIERKVGGYVLGKNTAVGFAKMQRRGAILPPFRLQDSIARLILNYYERVIAAIDKHVTSRAIHKGTAIKDAPYDPDDPLRARTRLTNQGYSKANSFIPDPNSFIPNEYRSLFGSLVDLISGVQTEGYREALANLLVDVENDFFRQFIDDASPRIALRVQYAIEADKLFQRNTAGIREYYLDTAFDRINEGTSELRKTFIENMGAWINGTGDSTGLADVLEGVRQEAGRFSTFFARDQMARMNKAMTLASFDVAGIKRVRWLTVGDSRVRPKHKALKGNVYPINKLPKEIHDYNCRCALIPVLDD